MFWVIFVVTVLFVVAGVAIYRMDKKVKAKYSKNFNPHEWALPGHIDGSGAVAEPLLESPLLKAPLLGAPAVADKIHYSTKPSVFTSAKLSFIKNLRAALTEEFALLTNINAADVLSVRATSNLVATKMADNNIAAKQIDVVLCDKLQLTPVCIIVLSDDKQLMLANACESAGLPMVIFSLSDEPNAAAIRASVLSALGVSEEKLQANAQAESVLDILEIKTKKSATETSAVEFKVCPACAGVMLKRKAKTGASAGKLFWICATYPKCRGMVPIQ